MVTDILNSSTLPYDRNYLGWEFVKPRWSLAPGKSPCPPGPDIRKGIRIVLEGHPQFDELTLSCITQMAQSWSTSDDLTGIGAKDVHITDFKWCLTWNAKMRNLEAHSARRV
jgi:hypothetical protein